MRNIEKTIANANVNPNYDMTCGELQVFLEKMNKGDPFLVIGEIFEFGYAVGQRALRKEMEIRERAGKAV